MYGWAIPDRKATCQKRLHLGASSASFRGRNISSPSLEQSKPFSSQISISSSRRNSKTLREASSQNSKILPGEPPLQPRGQWGREVGCCLTGALTSGRLPFYTQAQNCLSIPFHKKWKVALLEAGWHLTNLLRSQLQDSPKTSVPQAKSTTKHSGKVIDNNRRICFECTERPGQFLADT